MNEAAGILPEADDSLNCHERSEMTSRADKRAEHAEIGTIVAVLRVEGIPDETAVAGTGRIPAAPQADLRLELRGRTAD